MKVTLPRRAIRRNIWRALNKQERQHKQPWLKVNAHFHNAYGRMKGKHVSELHQLRQGSFDMPVEAQGNVSAGGNS